jgi:aspartate/tyrosine/aromatic aminotransferase
VRACLLPQDGKPLVLGAVRKAERRLLEDPTQNKEYLTQVGSAGSSRSSSTSCQQ